MSLQPGHRLAHYEVREPIGKGGMGEVYRATDSKLGRDVAIKVLPDEFGQDEERLKRFQREAKVLASLNHPNIASIYGVEQSDNTHYLVLELVPGETLAERIARGPIPVEEALQIAKKIAEALEEAHERGIVHRDLKPANIKQTEDGKIKVLDFGLAKAFVDESQEADNSMSPTLTRDSTRVGVILGTAAYMSPEQAKGRRVDRRTDIFAFGAVLFEMLTGRKTFPGEDVSDVLASVIKLEPDWNAVPSKTPPAIRKLLQRCLEKETSRRLQAIGDARIELDEALTGPAGVEEATPARHRSMPLVVMTVIASVTTALLVWSLKDSSAPAEKVVTRSTIPLAPGDVLARGHFPLALSLDGRHIAYVAQNGDSRQLYVRSLDELDARAIGGTEGARMPFFSPDGEWVGFVAGSELMKASVSGGAPTKIAEGFEWAFGASWAPDGQIVFTALNTTGLKRISADGGEFEILTVPDRGRGEKSHRWAEVLPGGSAVLFTLSDNDIMPFDDASIAVLTLATGEYRILIEGGMHARYSSTGHLVYARDGSLLAVPFDLDKLELTGTPTRVLEGLTTSSATGSAQFAVAKDGSLLYVPGRSWESDRRVVEVDREGRSRPLVESAGAFYDLGFAPDGSSLAVSIDGANLGLWLHDTSRDTLSRLATGSDNFAPAWAPDGKRLAIFSSRDGSVGNLFLLTPDGSDADARLTTSDYPQYPRTWSPDGKILGFDELRTNTGYDIQLLSMDGDGEPQPFLQTQFNEQRPTFSPNGDWLAYQSDESGRDEIYVRPFPGPGRKSQVSTEGGTIPKWSPDGRELFYRNGHKMMAVPVEADRELRLGNAKLLFEKPSVIEEYDVTPNGPGFAMIDSGELTPPPTQVILVQNWAEELNRLVPTDR